MATGRWLKILELVLALGPASLRNSRKVFGGKSGNLGPRGAGAEWKDRDGNPVVACVARPGQQGRLVVAAASASGYSAPVFWTCS